MAGQAMQATSMIDRLTQGGSEFPCDLAVRSLAQTPPCSQIDIAAE